MEFAGEARPLSEADIAAAAAGLGLEPALIAAVAEVESSGGGFLPDKRPKILYEAHVFGRLTGHRWDGTHPNLSAPAWDRSLYGPPGAHQYDRLHEAIALDRNAALQSASWGRFQILGQNYKVAGFRDVKAFVQAMTESEARHLEAFIGYCRANDLIRHLAIHDWRSFTRGYNGPGQVDHYAFKLEQAYRKHRAKVIETREAVDEAENPVELVKRAQRIVGVPDDGDPGPMTRAAIAAWKAAHP